MPYSDQEAFLNAYLKNYVKAQQNAVNSGKTGLSSARYTGQQAMNAAPTTLPDYGDIATSFTSAYTKQLAAVEAQREKEAKAAQAAAEKEARAAASAAKKASSSTTKSKKLKKEELKALDSELEEMAKTRVALQERKETRDTNTRERIKENVGDTAGISSLTAASRAFAPERKGSATKKRFSQRVAAGVKGLAKGASAYKQMQKARGGVSAEDSVDLGGGQTPQATAAKQKSRTKSRASVAKQNFTTQELDARLTATNQRMRELQKQGKTETREYRQLQNQHDTYATALGVDSFAGRAGAIELGAVTGFGGGVANMGDATLRAIRGQSASMDIPEYETASDDLQEANEQRDALIQMGRAYTDGPDGPVATPEFQKVLDKIKAAKDVRAENQITPEQNKVVKSILDYSTEQTQKAQAGLNDQGRFLVGAIGGVSQILPAFAAAAAAPEAAPVLIPALMGASAAGNRVNELEQRGIPLNQAVLRGAMSGAVSGVTNKLPLEQGAELIAGGGPGVLRAMARQALSEGGQEASEYAADYGLDVLAGDPDANFSLAELGQQALGGALGGAISAAGSSLIGSGVNRLREAQENAPVDTDVQQAEPVSPNTEAARQPVEAGQEALPGFDAVVDAYHNGNLTNAQIEQLKPGGELRQAFEEATGVKLPDTSSETRKTLKAEAQIQTIPTLSEDAGYVPAGYHAEDPGYIGGATSRDIAAEITGKDGKSVYTRQLADIRDRFLDAVQNGEDTSTIEQEAQALAEKIFPESAFVENTDADYVRALREALKKPVRVTDAELSDLENALGATRTEINRRYGLNLVKTGDASTSGLDQAVMELGEAFPDVDLFAHPADAFAEIVQKYDQLKDGVQAVDTESMKAARAYVADHILYGDSLDAAMAREAQTEAFDNFENSPYTETNAMQDGGEEVGTQGEYGRWNLDGVDFSADDRRAEGKTPEKPAFSGTGSTDNGIPEDGGSRFGGETPEKVREINGHRYTYGQPDAADYTAPVRTAADYAKQRYGLDIDVSDGPAHVDGNEHNGLMFTLPDGTIVANNAAALDPDTVTAMIDHEVMHNIQHKNRDLYARVDAALDESGFNPNAYRKGTDLYEALHGYVDRNPDFMSLDELPKFRRELSAQIAGYAYRPELAKSIFGDFVNDFDTVFDTVRSVLDERAQLGQQESESQGSTAATTIPELMPTQRVQEPIPTLEDHPNTVGSMESAFDAPEAPTRDINTQRRILDGLDDQRIRDLGPLDQDTHTVYTDEKARYDARQQMDLAYQEALQQGQDPSQAIQTALDTEMARLRGQEGAWNKTDRYTADVIQEELKRQWQNVEPGSDEYLVAQARYSAWASEERERASEAGRNLQANAGRLTGNSVTEKAQNMVHKIIGAYADKELSNGTKKQLSEFADDLAAEAEQLFGEGRQDLTSGMDTVSRMDKAAARVKELAQKYKVSVTEEQQRRLAASMLAGDKSANYYDRLLEFASGIQEIDLDTLERVDNYIYQIQDMPDNKERYQIEQRMYWELAQKLYPKAGFMDKVASWRYLCMLGNVRTHMRNIIGNVLMDATTRTKDTIAATIESVAQATGVIDQDERTKAILNPFSESDKALRGAAYKYATDQMYSELSGGRYSFQTEVQRARQVWDNKPLEWLRNASSETLGEEDRIGPAGLAAPFLKSEGAIGDFARKWTDSVQAKGEAGKIMLGGKNNSFASAMAQYLKAHGYDASVFDATDEASKGAVVKAAAYAKQEAFRATFAEASATAKWLNSAPGGAKLVVDALDPFAKTSGNVFKQGLRYSPVGLLNGLKKLTETGVNRKRGRGTVYQSSEIINSISEGLTGSAIMVLGGWLASMGVLRATGKEEEKGLDTAEGKQDYSFQLGNHSYTMDWTTPASMPLIMGASLYENGVSIDNIIAAAASLGDPVLDTMMLQSVNDTIDTIRYSGTDDTLGTLGNLGVQVGSSYAGQFVPTALGQVARSVDDTRRDSYGGGDSSLSRSVNRFVRKQENKIPFLSETNEPYVDVWGNERKNAGSNFAARLALNTLSPGFYSPDTEDETGRALRELAETTGNAAVLPSRASSSIDYNGGHYRLSPEEYTAYLKTSGQTAKYFADAITQSDLDPSEQEELIPQLYNVAKQIATQEVRDDYVPSTTYQSIMQLYNALGPDAVIDYKLMRLNADTNDNGRISKDEATAYLDRTGWSQSKKSAFLTATNKGWKNPYD